MLGKEREAPDGGPLRKTRPAAETLRTRRRDRRGNEQVQKARSRNGLVSLRDREAVWLECKVRGSLCRRDRDGRGCRLLCSWGRTYGS